MKSKENKNKKIVFKDYDMQQMSLPMSLEDLIPAGHVVRVVNEYIERMDLKPLLDKYKGGGSSSYHPKMMLKVIIYAYTQKVYSSRKIAKGIRENIPFMWLSGNNWPDFRTINRFRSTYMKDVTEIVFADILRMLVEDGYVKYEQYFLDGTKIEANSNRYRFVWAKSTKRYKDQLAQKVKKLFKEIDELNAKEDEEYDEFDLPEMGEQSTLTKEKLEQSIRELNEKLAGKPHSKKMYRLMRILKGDCLERQQRYERYQEILGDRNSFSKTDPDATFMRMKEDHMKNGQLKPAYNVQIGTEGQFILGYSIHQNRTDTGCLIDHLENLKQVNGHVPKQIIADAGYGSEENYLYLQQNRHEAYIKYNMFNKEQQRKKRKDPFWIGNWPYDEERDEFECPQGNRLTYRYTQHGKTLHGYETETRVYECENCTGCPVKDQCTKAAGNRTLKRNIRAEALRKEARSKLLSDQGKLIYGRRKTEPEPVFGHLKWNRDFKRFLLRGLDKVRIEWGLLSFAHNILKVSAARA
jgi:transposase